MTIKKSVINTFERVGINYKSLMQRQGDCRFENRFGGGSCETSYMIAYLINWVYSTSNKYEMGDYSVKIEDFDRVRYFVLEVDANAYSVCLD